MYAIFSALLFEKRKEKKMSRMRRFNDTCLCPSCDKLDFIDKMVETKCGHGTTYRGFLICFSCAREMGRCQNCMKIFKDGEER